MGLVGGQAKGFVSDAMMATTCTMKTGPDARRRKRPQLVQTRVCRVKYRVRLFGDLSISNSSQ